MSELTGGVSANVLGLEITTSAGGRRRVVFRQHRSAEFKQHGQTVTVTEYGVLPADEAERRRRTERFFERATRQLD